MKHYQVRNLSHHVWCGSDVLSAQSTDEYVEVTCKRCQDAFGKAAMARGDRLKETLEDDDEEEMPDPDYGTGKPLEF